MGDELTPIDFQISPAHDRDGNMFGLLATAVDISERKRVEKEKDHINKLAYEDLLTGLPNRRFFHERLEWEVRKNDGEHEQLVLMLIDLDRFKEINDAVGHDMGDMLLKEAANRLRTCVRDCDTVARMGGDEFAVILPEVNEFSSARNIAQDIIDSLSKKYVIMGRNIYTSASAGLAVCPDDATESSALIRYADLAMYRAKSDGRGRFNFFTRDMHDAAETRASLTAELRHALARNQLTVHFQPIVELSTGRIIKAESLLRWKHPTRGLVPPDAFIPIAEETGLIHEIGDWVFEQAAQEAKRCTAIAGPHFQISVNKSPLQFRGANRDHNAWLRVLERVGVPGRNIVIEITEGLIMNDDAAVAERFARYREAGIQVAIDDFGTGYSSLSYLNKFDLDYLKIDRSFISAPTNENNDVALPEAIVVMSHKLGLKVIAEGVETDAQRNVLEEIGCDYGQGYLFSPPVPADDFEALLTAPSKPAG